MTLKRRRAILQHIDDKFAWPEDSTEAEQAELVKTGFAFVDGAVQLTSLGELEVGYEELKPI